MKNTTEKIMYFCFAESAALLLMNILGIIRTSVAVCLIPVIIFVASISVVVVALLLFLHYLMKANNSARLNELMEILIKDEEKNRRKKDG